MARRFPARPSPPTRATATKSLLRPGRPDAAPGVHRLRVRIVISRVAARTGGPREADVLQQDQRVPPVGRGPGRGVRRPRDGRPARRRPRPGRRPPGRGLGRAEGGDSTERESRPLSVRFSATSAVTPRGVAAGVAGIARGPHLEQAQGRPCVFLSIGRPGGRRGSSLALRGDRTLAHGLGPGIRPRDRQGRPRPIEASLRRPGLRPLPAAVVDGGARLDPVRPELDRADPVLDQDADRLRPLRALARVADHVALEDQAGRLAADADAGGARARGRCPR